MRKLVGYDGNQRFYGILELDSVIEPYDLTLNKMSWSEIVSWYKMVERQMQKMALPPPDNIYFFCGERYHLPFQGQKPLKGLGIGKQLQWFSKNLEQKRGFNL